VPDVIVQQSLTLVKDSSRRASDFLVRIKREAENAEALRRALEEEREAVAEKYAVLDRDAEKKERARQIEFEQEMERAKQDFHERSQELLAAVSDKAERLKLDREVKKRSADFKKAAKTIQTTAQPDKGKGRVRVIRDGEEVSPESHRTPVATNKPQFVVVPDREIKAGDKVRLPLGTVGVVEQIKHGEAEVRVKSLRFREKLEALELVEEIPRAPRDKDRLAKLRPVLQAEVRGLRGLRGLSDHGQSETDVELIVIGQTTDQAVDTLDKFLDNAFMNNLTKVRIVHGHGTGALRRAIGEHLKQHPHVERFSPAPPNQGGSGATLVDLKA
jgi:DNA mismatch repair protein MutS2